MQRIAVDGRVALALVVGLYIDQVILLQIIGRREEGLLHVGEVYLIDLVDAVYLAVDQYGAAVTVDGQVTCHGKGIQQGEVVFADGNIAGTVDFSQYIDTQVDIFYSDNGVGPQFTGNEPVLDIGGHFLPGHASHAYLAQYGKVDGSLFIHSIGYYLGIARTLSGCGLGRGFGTQDVAGVCGCGEGKLLLQQGVAAVDHDVYLVLRTQTERLFCLQGHAVEGFCILEIGNVLGCGTGARKGEQQDKCE